MHTRWVVCTPGPHVTEHDDVPALMQLYVSQMAVLHGWLSPLHTTPLLAHSLVVTEKETPPHVFMHEAPRVITP